MPTNPMPSREEPAEGTDLKEPESKRNRKPSEVTARRLAPGDQAAPGTPGTAEDVCPECHGSGRVGANRKPAV
jgi:hypothetical protein